MRIFRKSWWAAPLISTYWIKALNRNAEGSHEQALQILDRIQTLSGPESRPMGGMCPEYYALRAHLLFLLGETDDAVRTFRKMRRELLDSPHYNSDEKDYLLTFAATCHAGIELGSGENSQPSQEINISSVRMGIRHSFPLKADGSSDDEGQVSESE